MRRSRARSASRHCGTSHGNSSVSGSHSTGNDFDDEVPERLAVMPGVGVAIDGLVKQDLVAIRGERRIRSAPRAASARARCSPRARTRAARSASAADAGAAHSRRPSRIAQQRERNQHQQRQEADALGDDAEARPRPSRSRTSATPDRAADDAAARTSSACVQKHNVASICACARLPHELHGEQQRQARGEPGLAIPQAAAEVVDQHDAAERRSAATATGRRCAASRSVAVPSAISQKNSGGLSAYGFAADTRQQPFAASPPCRARPARSAARRPATDRAGRCRSRSAAGRAEQPAIVEPHVVRTCASRAKYPRGPVPCGHACPHRFAGKV